MKTDFQCECGLLVPLGVSLCADCSAELDAWFDDMFDSLGTMENPSDA